MNKLLLIFTQLISFISLAQLPHGFTWVDNGKFAVNGIFKSSVRSVGDHVCFETNILILRDIEGKLEALESLPLGIHKHPFIPGLFLFYSKAVDMPSLEVDEEKVKKEYSVEVFNNQIFSMESTTNDPNFNRQWSIENTGGSLQYNGTAGADMEVVPAWSYSKGNGVKVAVLDSGVDTLHPDLLVNLLPGFDGYADSISNTNGYPIPNFSSDGHGTACAGIIAAVQDNTIGTTGIAPEAKLIPVRIFYYLQYAGNIGIQPFTSTLGLLNGAAYAWRIADCDIMSTSAGLSEVFISALQINTQLINDEIDSAYHQGRNGLGVSMFFSAGNDDINDVLWPANLNTTIAVGASDMCDNRKKPLDCSNENWGSTYGYGLDFVAPGVKIATTDMIGTEGYSTNATTFTFNGTSASCPNAAGVGALLLGANPALTNYQLRQILSSTAEKVTYAYDSIAPFGTWNIEMGYGRLNAHQAILMALNTNEVLSHENQPSLVFGQNPSETIWIKNNGLMEENVEIIDALGHVLTICILPNDVFNQCFSPGLYVIRFNSTSRKMMVI